MHEWAVAESVVKTVQNNDILREKKIKILLGELQNIDEEVFIFALNEIMRQMNFRFDFIVERINVEFKCISCEKVFSFNNAKNINEKERENIHFIPEMVNVFIKCPNCESVDFKIVKGRGVSITLAELYDNSANK
ncbi:MAG: hydrogenase nickel incorporation protein HypA [Elusimicrobiales bacterium]|nr:hydrogenase nickel incorporation protein HypA [Elusimicrobiales bacterium]